MIETHEVWAYAWVIDTCSSVCAWDVSSTQQLYKADVKSLVALSDCISVCQISVEGPCTEVTDNIDGLEIIRPKNLEGP
jgi:uncharacterized protein